MKTNLTIVFCVFFIAAKIAAQTTTLQGKVTNLEDIEGIHVLNNNSRNNSVTDAFGNFSIRAKVSDTLVFSSVHYLPQKVEVTQAIVESGIVVVTLEKLVNQLDEVFLGSNLSGDLTKDTEGIKVERPINFFDLGIPGFQGEPEEKIPTVLGQTIGPTHVDFEALYKHLSGYYKKLKIKRKWEAQNNTVARILYAFDEDFLEEAYEIPKDRTYDFILFCIETTSLQKDFNNENNGIVQDIFKEQASIYVSRLQTETTKRE